MNVADAEFYLLLYTEHMYKQTRILRWSDWTTNTSLSATRTTDEVILQYHQESLLKQSSHGFSLPARLSDIGNSWWLQIRNEILSQKKIVEMFYFPVTFCA
jgi:hypothetical protein